jgi:hypothetical protein
MIRPGPFTPQKRPSWNTTPRSYSRSTRIAEASSGNSRTMRAPKPMPILNMLMLLVEGSTGTTSSTSPCGRRPAPFATRLSGRPLSRLPELAFDADPAASCRPATFSTLAVAPISVAAPLVTGRLRACQRQARGADQQQGAGHGQRADQRRRDAEARHVGIDQHQRAGDEGDDAAESEDAEAGQEGLGHHQHQAEQDQRQPRIVHRQQLQGVERQQQADRADHARRHEARDS